MKKLAFLFLILPVITSCSKGDDEKLWERTFGKGEAYFIASTPDSGFVSCGTKEGSPFLVKLSKKKITTIDYLSQLSGLLTSAVVNGTGFIAAGSSDNQMLIVSVDTSGITAWEKTVDATFPIHICSIIQTDGDELIAIGSAHPDSVYSGASGLLIVKFTTDGTIVSSVEFSEDSFIAASHAITDATGNIILAVTRKPEYFPKTKAGVIKYNSSLQKLWETDLYTNPSYASSCQGIIADNTGNIFFAGKTETVRNDKVANTSVTGSLSASGAILWKRYLEFNNDGTATGLSSQGDLFTLSRNCNIISISDPSEGTDAGTVRFYESCDAATTTAHGFSMANFYDGSILVAGSRGESFYVALRAAPLE